MCNRFIIPLFCAIACLGQLSAQAPAADSVTNLTKTGMASSAFTVPEGKVWHVKSLTYNSGQYNILVTSVKFKDEYTAGEKIILPSWNAEAELLNANNTPLMYTLKIEERKK